MLLLTNLSSRIGGMLLTCTFLGGCASHLAATESGAPLARQVTTSDHCGLTAPGVLYLSRADEVDALSSLPAQTLNLSPLARLDFSREHLVIVALGQKPTGGYGVTLLGSEQVGDELRLEVAATAPAPDSMVTQVLTTPCSVMAVTAEGWDEVTVFGKGLQTVSRSR